MVTDGQGETDWSVSDDVAQQINAMGIELSILYISFAF
jgi:hypothetical protein